MKRIDEVEPLFTKADKQVSQTWKALIDDDELYKVTEQLRTTEEKVNQLQNKMKKLPLLEKMVESSNKKRLQQ